MAIGATKPATPAAVAGVTSGVRAHELGDTVPPDGADAASSDVRIPAGTMVSDRYRIARVLGEGGMGVVYAAEHVLMRKEVAVKVLHAEMCSMPEVVARFEREAIAAAHIDHPNVAAATDFGRLPDGACFLVLELLRGRSLRDEISKGAIPLGRTLRILRGIVSGVAAAHAKGIVHRDLKPENVMLVDRDGTADFVKVLDFGIAKVDPSFASAPRAGGKVLTRVGSVFGTPEYMAPEQAIGDTVDARADLYALGVIFLEMLTGKCPFTGNALSILRERILAEGPPDMSGIPDGGARGLAARLLTRQPDDRMQSSVELLAAIDGLLAERNGGSMPPPSMPPPSMQNVASRPSYANPAAAPSSPPPVGSARPAWMIPAAVAALFALSGAAFVVVTALAKPAVSAGKDADVKALATSAGPVDSSPAPAETGEPAPESTASAGGGSNTPEPAASAASARAVPRSKPAPRRHSQPAPRKTGPGGIYVPPPKEWFK